MASQDAIEKARKLNPSFSSYAVQKFNRLVVEGLVQNGHHVHALSSFHFAVTGRFYKRKSEMENGVKYSYITTPNLKMLRYIWLILYSFFYVLFWGCYKRREKVLICDVLNISVCIGALAAARLVGLKRIGIMTDMPGLMVDRSESAEKGEKRSSFTVKMNKSFLSHFTHYVFLTEQMNDVVNIHHRPYIVMEGLVDADLVKQKIIEKHNKRVVLYAGGLHERYGLKLLVEGFIKASVDNTELWLYGDGPFVHDLTEYCTRDSRIIYKGIRPNSEVVEDELKATILINPRPTHEEFTQYSFPSKNMEYMVSGTPVLTTILPGMPVEYYPYVYLFDKGENEEGFAMVLRDVLSLPENELNNKGLKAQKWVLTNKNNIKQAERIIQMVKNF